MKSFLTYLALPLSGLFLSLLVLELGFRLFGGESLGKQMKSDRPAFYYIPDDTKTFQRARYTKLRKKGAYRVAVVGDSFTFGPDMQYDDVFPSKLERMLNQNSSGDRVEVLNYGVPGYSTHHEVAEVREAIAGRADLVLLQITLNDPQLKPLRPVRIVRDGGFGEFQTEGKFLEYSKLASFVAQRLHNNRTHQRYIDYYHELFSRKGCWSLFIESLEKIARIAKKKEKTKFAVVIFPLFGLPLDDSYPFQDIHEKIETELTRLSIPYLDLFSAFRDLPLERLQLIPGKDFHPNEIAHRIAAEHIYLWLAKNQLVPESALVRRTYLNRKGPKLNGQRFYAEVGASRIGGAAHHKGADVTRHHRRKEQESIHG